MTLLGGCGRLREKQAVRRYALATREVDEHARKIRALGPALVERRGAQDTAALRRFLRESYLPMLQALVQAIRRLPAQTPALGSLKTPLLAQGEKAQEAIESLADRAGVGPLETAWERALAGRTALETALEAHGTSLDALCAKHDLRRRRP